VFIGNCPSLAGEACINFAFKIWRRHWKSPRCLAGARDGGDESSEQNDRQHCGTPGAADGAARRVCRQSAARCFSCADTRRVVRSLRSWHRVEEPVPSPHRRRLSQCVCLQYKSMDTGVNPWSCRHRGCAVLLMNTHAISGAFFFDMATESDTMIIVVWVVYFPFQALRARCYPSVKFTANFFISNGSLLHCLCYFVVGFRFVTCVKRTSNLHTVHKACSANPHRVVLSGYI